MVNTPQYTKIPSTPSGRMKNPFANPTAFGMFLVEGLRTVAFYALEGQFTVEEFAACDVLLKELIDEFPCSKLGCISCVVELLYYFPAFAFIALKLYHECKERASKGLRYVPSEILAGLVRHFSVVMFGGKIHDTFESEPLREIAPVGRQIADVPLVGAGRVYASDSESSGSSRSRTPTPTLGYLPLYGPDLVPICAPSYLGLCDLCLIAVTPRFDCTFCSRACCDDCAPEIIGTLLFAQHSHLEDVSCVPAWCDHACCWFWPWCLDPAAAAVSATS